MLLSRTHRPPHRSTLDVPSLSLSDQWQYDFANYSRLAACDDNALRVTRHRLSNTALPSTTADYTHRALPGGLTESGVLIVTTLP